MRNPKIHMPNVEKRTGCSSTKGDKMPVRCSMTETVAPAITAPERPLTTPRILPESSMGFVGMTVIKARGTAQIESL